MKNQEPCSLFNCVVFWCSDCYSLSVLRRTNSSYQDCVKHYRISYLQNGWVYISPGLTFPSLHHLVEHYSGLCWGCNVYILAWTYQRQNLNSKMSPPFSESADGLCARLTRPCFIQGFDNARDARPIPITVRRPTINWKDISRCGSLY